MHSLSEIHLLSYIVDPVYQTVITRILNKEQLFNAPTTYEAEGKLAIAVLDGIEINFDLVFRTEP